MPRTFRMGLFVNWRFRGLYKYKSFIAKHSW